MSDETRLFDELLTAPSLHSKAFDVEHVGDLAVVTIRGRRGPDWYYARRWVAVDGSRRLLFHVLSQAENHGFRFEVSKPAADPTAPPSDWRPADSTAAKRHGRLAPHEAAIYADLFPGEVGLFQAGYDWDDHVVWRHGERLMPDDAGRILEWDEAGNIVWEWVPVPDEPTWHRYPHRADRFPRAEVQA